MRLFRKIVMLSLFIHFPQSLWAKTNIIVDPGHGGVDQGAVHGGVHEAEIALKISQKLHALLEHDRAFKSFILRSSDSELSLYDRVEKSKKLGANIFVSIHANSSPNAHVTGAEFYIQSQMPPEEESKFLANRENSNDSNDRDASSQAGNVNNIVFDLQKTHKILESFELSWYLQKRWPELRAKRSLAKIHQGPFYVLSQNEITAVLIEVGYLSNAGERGKLVSSQYQDQIARTIYKGLKDYALNMDKVPSPALQPVHEKN